MIVPGAPLDVLTQDPPESPAIRNQGRMSEYVTSGFPPDPCEARDSSSAPGALPAANEPVEDRHHPRGLTKACLLYTSPSPRD